MFYQTEIGASYPTYTLYFADSSDLMDHLQNILKLTANEIEFSNAWRNGELHTKHYGTLIKPFVIFTMLLMILVNMILKV